MNCNNTQPLSYLFFGFNFSSLSFLNSFIGGSALLWFYSSQHINISSYLSFFHDVVAKFYVDAKGSHGRLNIDIVLPKVLVKMVPPNETLSVEA